MTITRTQAEAAANLVRAIASRWDHPSTVRIITELSETYPAADVVAAAIRTASNPDNRTQESLRFPANLPRTTTTTTTTDQTRPANPPRCDTCGRPEPACQRAQRRTGLDQHPFRNTPGRPSTPAELAEITAHTRTELAQRRAEMAERFAQRRAELAQRHPLPPTP
jgi:hypothetical protein